MLAKTLGLAIAAALCFVRIQPAEGASEKLVLAFYYAWYDASTWRSDHVPDLPATPYESHDPAAMGRQIDQAQRAGIDAFVLNWWGQGNPTDTNLGRLLDVAAGRGFRVAVDFDPNSPTMRTPSDYAANLRYLLNTHAGHPAYLRFGGRPVVFFFNTSRLDVNTWREIRSEVDPQHGAIWIAEGTDLSYQAVFDGHHLYSVAWANQIPASATLPKWGDLVRAHNAQTSASKLWIATVMPGYDDTRIRSGGFVVSRRNGDYYRECWRAALASNPDMVIINSWNEWPEGSYIEPSQAYGSLFLEITAQFAAQFRASPARTTAPSAPSVPPAAPTRPAPTPTPAWVDYAVDRGWFFSQAAPDTTAGYTVTDEERVPFWSAYVDRAGPLGLGYPTSARYRWEGFVFQQFEWATLVWHPTWSQVEAWPGFDELRLARRARGHIR